MVEREEELKSLLMKARVKLKQESEKAGLKHKIQKTKIMASGPIQFSLVQLLSHVYLRPHELQHARPPCPSPTPRVHSDSCASCQ